MFYSAEKLGILDQNCEPDLLIEDLEIDFDSEKDDYDLFNDDKTLYLLINDAENKIYDLK